LKRNANLNLDVRAHIGALAAYVLLSCLLTWPTILDLGGHVYTSAGGVMAYPGHDDIIQNVWNLWWLGQSVRDGANPFFTSLLYHPEGMPLYLHTLNFTNGVITLPVQWLAGPVAAYNLGLLLAFTLTGYAIWLWGRMVQTSWLAAWIAGALVTAAPFHMFKLDVNHYNLVQMQWLAFCAPAMLYAERYGGWRGGLPLAAALILTVFGDWYWALTAAVFVSSWASLSLLAGPKRWARLSAFFCAGGLVGLVVSPILLGALRTRTILSPLDNLDLVLRSYSADLFVLFAPSLRQPFWTDSAEQLARLFVRNLIISEGWYLAAGWLLMALAGIGLWRGGSTHWRPLAAAAIGFILSLGPALRVLGIETGISMPFAWLIKFEIFEIARRPNLFAVSCFLVAGLCAALGLDWLLARSGRWRNLFLLGLALLAVLELWPPQRYAVSLAAPAVYHQVATQSGPLLDLPMGYRLDGRTLQNQLTHGQPIVRGYVSRSPITVELDYEPLLHALTGSAPLPSADIIALDQPTLVQRQCRYGWRNLVIATDFMASAQQVTSLAALERLAGAVPQPWYNEQGYQAYELPPVPLDCQPYLFLGTGWYALEADPQEVWRWFGDEAKIWLINPSAAQQTVTLSLRMFNFLSEARPLTLWLDAEPVAHFMVPPGVRNYHVILTLPPQRAQLVLRSLPVTGPDGRSLSLRVYRLDVH
jgi:hypothetical protein